jgi:hypothetical protein
MDSPLPEQYAMHIEVYSHGFRVSRFSDTVRRLLVELCRSTYVYYESSRDRDGKYVTEAVCTFAAATVTRDQYFFHRNTLEHFYHFMETHGIRAGLILRTERPMYEPAMAELVWIREDFELRDYQNDIVEFCDKPDPRTKLVTLQAGQGKTSALMGYMDHAQLRTALIMKPMYIDQWKKEILKTFKLRNGDFIIVEGSEALKELIAMAKMDGFHSQIIIISNATFRNYLTYYFDHPHTCEEDYGCLPWEFFELLKIGVVGNDEAHQEFHLNFLVHCMGNMCKYVAMSATMVNDNPSMNKYYRIMFPSDTYAPKPPLKKYIDVYSVFYRFLRPDWVRYLARGMYNQNIFEKSIRKRKTMLLNYTKMIADMIKYQFFQHSNYTKGMKALVYCGTVDMCTEVTETLQKAFPDKTITRFCATVDKESNLYDDGNDVIVTTLKSCGTARDIANLMLCVSTVALNGLQASEQLIHRLREPKSNLPWAGVTPRFIFLVNNENPKHRKYDEERKYKLKHVVKNFNQLSSSFVV